MVSPFDKPVVAPLITIVAEWGLSNVPVVVNAAGSSVWPSTCFVAVATLQCVVVAEEVFPVVNKPEYPVGATVKSLSDLLVVHAAINKFFCELQDVVNDGGLLTLVDSNNASGVPS